MISLEQLVPPISVCLTVSDAVKQNDWSIRGQRSRYYHDLYDAITAEPVPDSQNGSNVVLWRQGEDDYQEKYLSSKTWDQSRMRKEVVGWSKVVWFPQGVPRLSFITWLAVKNMLSTGDRMRSWGIICSSCVLTPSQFGTAWPIELLALILIQIGSRRWTIYRHCELVC